MNKWGLSCAPFTGINLHKKTVIFAYDFMLDETTESFVQLFKTFLKEMGDRHPITIFTDQALAVSNAINKYFQISYIACVRGIDLKKLGDILTMNILLKGSRKLFQHVFMVVVL